jgi:hypothetical protein
VCILCVACLRSGLGVWCLPSCAQVLYILLCQMHAISAPIARFALVGTDSACLSQTAYEQAQQTLSPAGATFAMALHV